MLTPNVKEVADGYREFSGEEVPLWHFAMMNDSVRNEGYDRALGSALQRKKGRVLDIGTGSGLLAMMAARHGASQVVSCEVVPAIAKKATEIIQKNGYADRVQVVKGYSTKLELGGDIQERFDVLVTEIFDDGLLGEEAFKAIKHAKEHLLKPDAQIIPSRVRVMAMAIESPEIFNNYRVSHSAGFDVSGFNEFSVQGYVGIHLDKMRYRPLSRPVPVFNFDFQNIPGEEAIPIALEIFEDGAVHAIAYWFELSLDDTTMVSSGPGLAKLSSWKQAVQVANNVDSFRKGDRVSLVAHHNDTAIWFDRP